MGLFLHSMMSQMTFNMYKASLFSILFLIPLFASVAEGVSFLEVSSGKGITVLNSSAAKELISTAKDEGMEVLTYDQMTGILIVEKTSAKNYPVAPSSPLAPMDTLHDETGKKVATVIGIERKNDNKILPFGYLRIQYYAEAPASGTFLFNSRKQLCAILYNSDKKYKNQGYATPIKAVLRGAEDFKKNGKLSGGRIGVITSTSGSIPEVLSVRPEQPAALAGVKKGDFLLQVGKQKISSYLEMREAFYYLIVGKPERFTIMRNGEKKVITITPVGG